MNKRIWIGFVALTMGTAVTFSVVAQIKKGKTRSALTKQLMGGLVQPNCAALGKVGKEAPADDKAWAALATNAALLNEAGYLLMDDGRCPDAEWANAAKTLQMASAAVLEKLEAKDPKGASEEFEKLTKACGACHAGHKK